MNPDAKLFGLLGRGGHLTWEEIGQELGLTRQAVWNRIRFLRERGYGVESVPHLGYRLESKPDTVEDFELESLLEGTLFSGKIHVFGKVTSTNDVAEELYRKNPAEGLTVLAHEQTQGRGRLGRQWFSPARRGLWFSVALAPKIAPENYHQLTFMAAAAFAKTLNRKHGLPVRIKWPNDLMLDGKKCGGILTEIKTQGERIRYAVVGTGINWDAGEEDFAARGLAHAAALGAQERRVECLAAMLCELEKAYALINRGKFEEIRKLWLEYADILGKTVRVESGREAFDGEVEGIDDAGALRVRIPGGAVRTAVSGDVTVVCKLRQGRFKSRH